MLTGTLDDFTLADVLRLIAGARRTGGLDVTRDGGAGSLYFRDGAVCRALARYDRPTGASSPDGAIGDLTFDLMRWSRGEFAWTPGTTDGFGAGGEAAVDVDELLREVSRRLEELAQIQTLVPSEEAVLAMAPQPPEGAVQINISPAEWRVLVLVDGHRTVAEIAAATHLDDLEAMKLLYELAAAGLVTTDEAPAPPEMSDTTDMTAMSDASDTPWEEDVRADAKPVAPEPPAPEPVAAPAEPPSPPHDDPAEEVWVGEFADLAAGGPASPFDGLGALPEDLHESPAVDRSTAARELAGLFDAAQPASAASVQRIPRRVEDDDQVTRGLISRLIDGVKGL